MIDTPSRETGRRTRKSKLGWLLVGAASMSLLLAACSDDGDDDGPDTTPTTTVTTPTTSPTTSPTTDPTGPTGSTGATGATGSTGATGGDLTGTFDDIADVGASGDVTVSDDMAGGAEVMVEMTALPEGMYSVALTAGTCDALGEVAFDLGELEADATGDVSETYSVAADSETIGDGHVVVVEDADAELVACAELS